jgi:hypothetical protein
MSIVKAPPPWWLITLVVVVLPVTLAYGLYLRWRYKP